MMNEENRSQNPGGDQEMQKLMHMLQSGVTSVQENKNNEKPQLFTTSPEKHMAQPENTKRSAVFNTYVIVALILGLLVGFGVGRATDGNLALNGALDDETATTSDEGEDAMEDKNNVAGATGTREVTTDSNFIEVKDQIAGTSVFITRVGLTEVGWVAIHENRGNDLGNVLGAKRFEAGVTQGTITLLRGTTAGNTYYAVLYGDDGDLKFDFKKDPVLAALGGDPILFEFETFSGSEVESEDTEMEEDSDDSDEEEVEE